MTVNHDVAGSSPAGGATQKNQNKPITYSDFLTIWPVGQAVKTPPFHGGNAGSIPARVTTKKLFIMKGFFSFAFILPTFTCQFDCFFTCHMFYLDFNTGQGIPLTFNFLFHCGHIIIILQTKNFCRVKNFFICI